MDETKRKRPFKKRDIRRGGLTEKQEKFCQGLASGLTQHDAYKQAYNAERMTRASINVRASVLARDPKIELRVKELRQATLHAAKDHFAIETAEILRELHALATVDVRKFYDKNGNILPVHEWPDDVAKAVVSLETNELFEGNGSEKSAIGFVKKIKLCDKAKALDMCMRHLGEYEKDNKQLNDPLHQLVQAILGGVAKPGIMIGEATETMELDNEQDDE